MFALRLSLALLALAGVLSAVAGQSVPIFSLTNTDALKQAGQVSYQVMEDHAGSVMDLLSQLSSSASADKAADVVVVALSKQLVSDDLRKPYNKATFKDLAALLDGANSSTVLPYALSKNPVSGVMDALRRVDQDVEIVDVEAEDSLKEWLSKKPADASGPRFVAAVLPHIQGALGSAKGLAAEVQHVIRLDRTLRSSGLRYGLVYTAEKPPLTNVGSRRRLQETVYICDKTCKTQVRWLEGILVVTLGAVGLMVGLCCLHILDTPTRFETPKDSGSRDQ